MLASIRQLLKCWWNASFFLQAIKVSGTWRRHRLYNSADPFSTVVMFNRHFGCCRYDMCCCQYLSPAGARTSRFEQVRQFSVLAYNRTGCNVQRNWLLPDWSKSCLQLHSTQILLTWIKIRKSSILICGLTSMWKGPPWWLPSAATLDPYSLSSCCKRCAQPLRYAIRGSNLAFVSCMARHDDVACID